MYVCIKLEQQCKSNKGKEHKKKQASVYFHSGGPKLIFFMRIWLKTQEDCASAPNYNQTGQLLFLIVFTLFFFTKVKHVSGEEPQPSVWAETEVSDWCMYKFKEKIGGHQTHSGAGWGEHWIWGILLHFGVWHLHKPLVFITRILNWSKKLF